MSKFEWLSGFLISVAIFIVGSCNQNKHVEFQTGDIIGHTSRSSRSGLIEKFTVSKFTHVGIIEKINGKLYVVEASNIVKRTKLKDWIARGRGGKYVVVRVKEHFDKNKLKKELDKYIGLPYDAYYSWDDKRMYCSELVYKVFLRGVGIKLCKMDTIDFEKILRRLPKSVKSSEKKYVRYFSEKKKLIVVTPRAIMESKKTQKIFSNY